MKVTSHVINSQQKKSFRHAAVKNHVQKNKKGDSKKTKEAPKKKSGSFGAFLSSRRMIQVYGCLILAFSLLLFVSMLSFYFHAHNNLFYVQGEATTAENLARSVGAHLSFFFIQNIFGIVSIGFPFLFFLYGVKIVFEKSLLPLGKATLAVILTMAWCSVTLGVFFTGTENTFLCGYFGDWLGGELLQLGKLVSVLILLLFLVIILILCYDFSLKGVFERTKEAIAERKNRHPKERTKHSSKNNENKEPFDLKDLDDLYTSDHGCLTKEYHGKNTYEFDPETETGRPYVAKDRNGKNTAAVTVQSPIIKHNGESDEVPFDLVSPQEAEPEPEENNEDIEETEDKSEAVETAVEERHDLEPYDPRKELSHYKFPDIDLLNDYPAKATFEEQLKNELLENKKRIESTLKSFNIPIKRISATVGPTVTLYEIVPDEGVRISKIKSLEDDIALSLAALGIRIIAPIPGRGTIGIEVPNRNSNIVSMKEVIASDKFRNNRYELPIGLGKTINNEPFVIDLAKMPHLLVAGATGQGKSVGLNAIITSLLYTKHPAEMKLVLIDPKKVEFTLYADIENYYLTRIPDNNKAIITDTKKVVRTLNALCKEMDDRYDLLELAKVRNIREYNTKFCARCLSPALGHRYMPYIVLVIDEFGDLIITAGREVETPLARLAQLARAIGIHLVIATQRPSVNVITGSIKNNFPARIAFRVVSNTDSRTILDSGGANQLVGKGDMLISTGSDLIRLQCAFVDTPEVARISEFIARQAEVSPLLEPYMLPDIPDGDTGSKESDFDPDSEPASGTIDPLFVDAATLIVQTQIGSTSHIQRRMKLGYNRAGRIMDQLEEFGIVGQTNGSKPREVLVKTDTQLRELLASRGLL